MFELTTSKSIRSPYYSITSSYGVVDLMPSIDSKVVSIGLSLQGMPYKWDGTTPAGFDCSGFLLYAYKQAGKSTPQPGDLVFFVNTYRPEISHAGIYIGNNQFVHSGGSKAEVVSLDNSYWDPKFHSFRSF